MQALPAIADSYIFRQLYLRRSTIDDDCTRLISTVLLDVLVQVPYVHHTFLSSRFTRTPKFLHQLSLAMDGPMLPLQPSKRFASTNARSSSYAQCLASRLCAMVALVLLTLFLH